MCEKSPNNLPNVGWGKFILAEEPSVVSMCMYVRRMSTSIQIDLMTTASCSTDISLIQSAGCIYLVPFTDSLMYIHMYIYMYIFKFCFCNIFQKVC